MTSSSLLDTLLKATVFGYGFAIFDQFRQDTSMKKNCIKLHEIVELPNTV